MFRSVSGKRGTQDNHAFRAQTYRYAYTSKEGRRIPGAITEAMAKELYSGAVKGKPTLEDFTVLNISERVCRKPGCQFSDDETKPIRPYRT